MAKYIEERRVRGAGGTIAAFLFWAFNLLMLAWVVSYWASIGGALDATNSAATRAGAVIGTTIGTGLLGSVWIIGDLFLGALMLATRGHKVLIEHDSLEAAEAGEDIIHLGARGRGALIEGKTLGVVQTGRERPIPSTRTRSIGILVAVIIGVIVVITVASKRESPTATASSTPSTVAAIPTPVEPKEAPAPKANEPPSPPPEPPDKWSLSHSTSGMDDSPMVVASLESDNSVSFTAYDEQRAQLYVRCRERKTDVVLSLDKFINTESAKVTYRIDDQKAKTVDWVASTNYKGLFSRSAVAFAKQIAKASTLRMRFTPYGESAVEFTFNVKGLDRYLPEIAKACGWKA